EPDLSIRGSAEGFDDAVFDRVETDPAVQSASPVLEIDTYALVASGKRLPLRVLGIDALRIAALTPSLLPQPAAGQDRLVMLDPGVVFANAQARDSLGLSEGSLLRLQSGVDWVGLRQAGHSAAAGAPLVVMDIAGAQQHFAALGRLSRIDLRLQPGTDVAKLVARLALPPTVRAVAPGEAEARLSNLSRAYRVNLTVLALVALFVGAFLVFSVVSLSVAQRTPGLALLGVLGLTSRQRRGLVLAECAVLGAAGSGLGLLLGLGMAAAALRLLAGDLGGGYFPGIVPPLQVSAPATVLFGLLGVASALAGGWWPARQAQAIAPVQALKGLGTPGAGTAPPAWPGLLLMALGALGALAPPVAGLPLAAYAAVAALLFGGVVLVPAVVHALLAAVPRASGALPLLALQRAKFQRRTATAAVAGVVASLALSVALTVMVSSFRSGVTAWLDGVLPADLYARSAGGSSSAAHAWLPPQFGDQAARVQGVERVQTARLRPLILSPGQPSVTLIARDTEEAAQSVPLLQPALPLSPGEVGVFVSEAVVDLYRATPGTLLQLPLGEQLVSVRVRGVWRDYARQFGAVLMSSADYQRITGDLRSNELALWLAPDSDAAAVQAALRALLPDPSMLDFASTAELRKLSLRIFDRSFAVTYYLQAVAITIGLIGVAASLSAQVLARRKEFGLLAHLGFTRRQVLAIVTGECAVWTGVGAAIGVVLG
ncbi:MAG TPA: ABC transporter permease, partial [Rubrivivax sp.]|nr:ABC transporter permease [Rubrivivax sp.]